MVFLITAFFVAAPLIIAYTAGYRYNWQTNQIEQTGVISIDVEPRDVEIIINGIHLEKRSPLRLTDRAPGSYRLEIKKTGFKTWQKDITVVSKQTTYIKNISLFPNALPIRLSTSSTDPLDALTGIYSPTSSSTVEYTDNQNVIWQYRSSTHSLSNSTVPIESLILEAGTSLGRILNINAFRAIIATDRGIEIIPRRGQNAIARATLATDKIRLHPFTKEWLVWSPWEIWTIYEDGHTSLLNRQSEAISDVLTLDRHGVLLLVTDTALIAFNPGYYTSQALWRGGKVERAAVDIPAKKIIFLGTVGEQRGMYELTY